MRTVKMLAVLAMCATPVLAHADEPPQFLYPVQTVQPPSNDDTTISLLAQQQNLLATLLGQMAEIQKTQLQILATLQRSRADTKQAH